MTAEQLEELLGKVTAPITDWDAYYDAENKLEILAPALARRVIAAEKLIAKLDDVVESRHIIDLVPEEDTAELDALDAAYREASKASEGK